MYTIEYKCPALAEVCTLRGLLVMKCNFEITNCWNRRCFSSSN